MLVCGGNGCDWWLLSCGLQVLFYSLIARGKTVLAEYTARSGNFPTVTRLLLSEIGGGDTKMSVVYDRQVRRCPGVGATSLIPTWDGDREGGHRRGAPLNDSIPRVRARCMPALGVNKSCCIHMVHRVAWMPPGVVL